MKKYLWGLCFILGIGLNGAFAVDIQAHIFSDEENNKAIERVYSGEFIQKKTVYPTYLTLKDGKYSFEVASAKTMNLFDIPENLIKSDYYIENGSFNLQKENGFPVVLFSSEGTFEMLSKAGFLNYGRLLYLCKGNEIIYDSLFYPMDPFDFPYAYPVKVSVSSFLKEKNISYDAENFKYDNSVLKPWVEGKKGYGEGEYIEFEIGPDSSVDGFLISNGYVNFEKPYLYEANSRVKRFHIVSEENQIDCFAELKDECNFQLVVLPKALAQNKANKIRLIIDEVFKGTKWDDTCINRIIPVKSKFIANNNQ